VFQILLLKRTILFERTTKESDQDTKKKMRLLLRALAVLSPIVSNTILGVDAIFGDLLDSNAKRPTVRKLLSEDTELSREAKNVIAYGVVFLFVICLIGWEIHSRYMVATEAQYNLLTGERKVRNTKSLRLAEDFALELKNIQLKAADAFGSTVIPPGTPPGGPGAYQQTAVVPGIDFNFDKATMADVLPNGPFGGENFSETNRHDIFGTPDGTPDMQDVVAKLQDFANNNDMGNLSELGHYEKAPSSPNSAEDMRGGEVRKRSAGYM